MKLNNKVALITGAAQGIGKAIAEEFAKEGAELILCDIQEEKIDEVAESIEKDGGKAISIKADVSSVEDVSRLFEFVEKEYENLDILVNNTGISPKQKFEDITPEDWDKVLDVNLKGVFLCTREAIKIMKNKSKGRIINISSMAAQNGGTTSSPHYVASKAGIIGFTKSMSKVLGPENININAIAPGRIKTELYHKDVPSELNKKIMERIPLGKPGQSEDVAKGVVFLASDSSNYITGACLNINGGLCLTS